MMSRTAISRPATAARSLRAITSRAIHVSRPLLADKPPTADAPAAAPADDKNGSRGILGVGRGLRELTIVYYLWIEGSAEGSGRASGEGTALATCWPRQVRA